VAELEAELSAAREERESVAEEYEAAVRERDSLADERDRYRQRAEELRERVEELEAELSSTREELDRTSTQLQEAREELAAAREAGEAPPSGRSVSPTEALSGAHVLVRYDQASGPTLAKARDGEVGRPEVNDNLRLEYHHTRFDADDAVVDGRTFDEFLVDTTQYRFVRWVVEELMYEIVETGNREGLDRLYDAIPESNRAEFEGGVTVPVDDGGGHESLSFDVVIRDRMGNPLVVADLNAGRDAATESQMVDLVEKGRKVAAAKEPFAGAFLVTASFFDPAALETADDATESGGLLGGGSRRSYVKLSRKTGFHLCLVETRDGAFHVNVPEL
jgi:DNA gyrase/topoisomerase IV subunit A